MHNHTFIFLAGVHGAGKTTLCQQSLEPMGFHCVSASSIIKSQDGDVVEAKVVRDIPDNQVKLVRGTQSLRAEHQRLAMDGHFVILNRNFQMEDVDVSVFKELQPDSILLLFTEPTIIAQRLNHRNHGHWEVSFIDELQSRELRQASMVAEILGIPFYRVTFAQDVGQICEEILSRKT